MTRADLVQALAEQIVAHGKLEGLVERHSQRPGVAHELAESLVTIALQGQRLEVKRYNEPTTRWEDEAIVGLDESFRGLCATFGAGASSDGDPRGAVYSIVFQGNGPHARPSVHRINANAVLYGED